VIRLGFRNPRKRRKKVSSWRGWEFSSYKAEVFGGTKIYLFEFGFKYLNFGATSLSFGAIYLSFGAIYLRQKFKIESFRRGGEGGWVPQDLREVSSSVSGKNIPHTDGTGTPY